MSEMGARYITHPPITLIRRSLAYYVTLYAIYKYTHIYYTLYYFISYYLLSTFINQPYNLFTPRLLNKYPYTLSYKITTPYYTKKHSVDVLIYFSRKKIISQTLNNEAFAICCIKKVISSEPMFSSYLFHSFKSADFSELVNNIHLLDYLRTLKVTYLQLFISLFHFIFICIKKWPP